MRCTWRKFGNVGLKRARERCFTVTPRWASPSTPSPAISRMSICVSLLNLWRGPRLTATTRAPFWFVYSRSRANSILLGFGDQPRCVGGQQQTLGHQILSRLFHFRDIGLL